MQFPARKRFHGSALPYPSFHMERRVLVQDEFRKVFQGLAAWDGWELGLRVGCSTPRLSGR